MMSFKKIFKAGLLIGIITIIIAMIIASNGYSTDNNVEGRVKTVYDINGRPVNQSQDSKGWHRVSGTATLSSGVANIQLNTSTANGKQDISFMSENTYSGTAWSLDTSNTNTYRVYPVNGSSFLIKSSSGTDSATVGFKVEGE